jgi:hypothetical protein
VKKYFMKKFLKVKKHFALVVTILFLLMYVQVPIVYAYSNPAAVPLLTVANFAALAKTTITSPTGPTVLNNGNLGIDSPGVCTGFASPCTASGNGTINGGSIQFQNGVALQGQTDATASVTNIGLRSADATLLAQLGGQTLTQGVYQVPAAATNLTGDLTLSGDASSVFIFHLTSTFITDSGSRILLTGGVQACNVFWKVDSSATFNGTTTVVGTVLAQSSVSFVGGGATLNGRAIAQTAAVTFNNTTVNNSSCAAASNSTPTTVASTSNGGSNSNSGGNNIAPCIASEITTIPLIIESKRISPTSVFLSWGPFAGLKDFNIQYGLTDGSWLYNTNVTGFSTTINDLPANQPIWTRVAARNNCAIGTYGPSKMVGSPRLPNAGYAPQPNNTPVYLFAGAIFLLLTSLVVLIRKNRSKA